LPSIKAVLCDSYKAHTASLFHLTAQITTKFVAQESGPGSSRAPYAAYHSGENMRNVLSAIVFMLAAGPAVGATALSPQAIQRDIDLHGAGPVVRRLLANGDYERVMDRIDAGDGRWIALAPKLAPGADAGAAEELPIALAFALPKNAHAVLSVLGPNGFPIEDVCSAPFIEGTVKDVRGYIRRAEQAVSAVGDPKLATARDACLAELRKT